MINFKDIAQQTEQTQLSGSKLVEALLNIDENQELKQQITSMIPLLKMNDREVIDPVFLNFLLNIDPIKEAENILDIERHSPEAESDAALSMGMFVSAVKKAMLSIANELCVDFSANRTTWDEYIDNVKALGFEEISRKDFKSSLSTRTEESVVFFHPQHSMLWEIRSYSHYKKKVSSSSLYFNGKIRDGQKLPSFRFSMGYIAPSGVYYFDTNMTEMPSHKFFEILTCIKPVQSWGIFNIWNKEVLSQIETFPTFVKQALLDMNIICYEQNDFIKNKRNSIVEMKAKEILKSLTEEEAIYFFLFCRIQKFSDFNTVLAPSFINNAIKKSNENELYQSYLLASLMFHTRLFDEKASAVIGKRSLFRAAIETLESKDLVDLYDTFNNLADDFQELYFTDDDQALFTQKMSNL